MLLEVSVGSAKVVGKRLGVAGFLSLRRVGGPRVADNGAFANQKAPCRRNNLVENP